MKKLFLFLASLMLFTFFAQANASCTFGPESVYQTQNVSCSTMESGMSVPNCTGITDGNGQCIIRFDEETNTSGGGNTINVWMNDGTCTDSGIPLPGGGAGGDCGSIPESSERNVFSSCGTAGSQIRWTREDTSSGPRETTDNIDREDRFTTYNIMTCTTITLGDKLWVSGRVPAAGTDGHRRFCQASGYMPVYNDAGGICASDENRPGTYNYTVLGLGGSPNGGGDFIRRDDGSNRCYKTGQKQDDDRSDKDKGSLCQEYTLGSTSTTTTTCTAYESTYSCTAQVCNANEVDTETTACGTGFIGDQTRTNTCNSTGTDWLGWTGYDRSACEEIVCTANAIETETQSCPAGYTGDETRERSCNSNGTSWGSWSAWNTGGCLVNTCTADEVATESVACGTGFVGDQTRTNTCNSTGTAWLGWTDYDRSACVAVVCSANEVENETRTCPAGYTGDETRNRTCNNIGTAWGDWTNWDNSGCLANACTPNEVDTQSIACGTGYTGNQTRTNTCNSTGTDWLGWTGYDRSACVEAIAPTATVTYTPAGPAWTTSDVVVRITCSDPESGCDMVSSFPASWSIVSGVPNAREYTYSSNVVSSILLYDNAGNSTLVPYSIAYIDQSTPGAPTITADDRNNDEWQDDNTTVLTTTVNNTGVISPRTNRYCMDASNTCTPNATATPSTSGLSDGTYYYRARTCTSAGRCGPTTTFIIKVDTTAPTSSNISVVPGTSGPLLANNNQNFQVSASEAGGSPIVAIEGYFENAATTNSYLSTPETSTSALLNFNASIEQVDNDRQSAGYREYGLKIERICDEAGNCTVETDADGIRTFAYQVYANTNTLGDRTVSSNELDSSSNIADGSTANLEITLEDTYGNAIVPASGIGRTISFDFNTDNSMHLNQYDRSGGSSVFINSTAWTMGTNTDTSFTNQTSTDGTYNFDFSVYTPTYQTTGADPSARFDINSINTDISGTIGAQSNVSIDNSTIVSSFAPLYTTQFSGELVNNGFVEGAIQASNTSVTKASSGVTPFGRNIFVQYGGETTRLRLNMSTSGDPVDAVSESSLSTVLASNFGNTSYAFNTLLLQEGGTIEDIQETYLSSHIGYILDGNDIVYNGDVIGKTNYHDSAIDNNTSQAGIKVVGISSSENTSELTTGQFTDDVSILGKLTKSTSRKDIQASVFSVIKNITPVNGTSRITRLDGNSWASNSDGTKLRDDSVLYFGNLAGANVELGNGGDETIEGKKTIVIEGGNLYIRSNMQYNNPSNDILGIVILQDDAGNGGNLYIDPSVTDIHASIYLDKSVISYNGTSELDGNTPASTLANQLYIYGSLFSENTIGGSRSNPLECPYYVSVCNSTVEAQKYDLNYLRRYILIDHDDDATTPSVPAYGGTPSDEGATFDIYPVVVDYNSKVQSTPPPLFD